GRAVVGVVAGGPLVGARVEAAGVFGVAQRRGVGAVGPGGFGGGLVEPGRQFVAAGLDPVLGVGVVQGRGDPVGRRPLQRGLPVGALAAHRVDRVQQVLRNRIVLARAGRVGRIGRGLGLGQRIAPGGAAEPAAGDAALVVAEVAVLVAAAERDAKA